MAAFIVQVASSKLVNMFGHSTRPWVPDKMVGKERNV